MLVEDLDFLVWVLLECFDPILAGNAGQEVGRSKFLEESGSIS